MSANLLKPQEEFSGSENNSKVRVALRVRPFIPKELKENATKCVRCFSEQNKLIFGKDKDFEFDSVFDENSSQEKVYVKCVRDLVMNCFKGYNATILAYGQTGSGKTFTMGSSNIYGITESDLGIIPRVIREIFAEIDKRKNQAEFLVKVTYLEIYNEEIIDLLDRSMIMNRRVAKKESSVNIREEKDGSISVYGITEEKVNSMDEMMSCLEQGSLHRSTSSTLMNETSSRSHAIFTIIIEQHLIEDLFKSESTENIKPAKNEGDSENAGFMTAKFHFVDLAGSERIKKTGATGGTMKEGININLSLLTLGNVISALTEPKNKQVHVPYRESKLTRILQDSLGGNSHTYMIACVSPAESNFDESLNTIKYASRARNIKNKPIVNRDPQSAMISQLKQQIFDLQNDIKRYRQILISNNIKIDDQKSAQIEERRMSVMGMISEGLITGGEADKTYKLKIFQYEKQITGLEADLQTLKKSINEREIETYMVVRERDLFKINLDKAINLLSQHNITWDFDDSEEQISKKALLEDYESKIEAQKSDLQDKERLIKELQIEYENLLKSSSEDHIMLLEKIKQNDQFRKKVSSQEMMISSLKKMIPEKKTSPLAEDTKLVEELAKESIRLETDIDLEGNNCDLNMDTIFGEGEEEFQKITKITEQEIALVQGTLAEKEKLLSKMNDNQKLLQKNLLEEMQNQYHKKMTFYESELKQMIKQRDEALLKLNSPAPGEAVMVLSEKTRIAASYKVKIMELESKLKDSKKKDKEQGFLAKQMASQQRQIAELDEEIKRMKMQKLQLIKKMKDDSEKFDKWKALRQKEFLDAKKMNFEKDVQITKLKNENMRRELSLKKAAEHLADFKRSQQIMKTLIASNVQRAANSKAKKTQAKNSIIKANSSFKNLDLNSILEDVSKNFTEEDAEEVMEFCAKKVTTFLQAEMNLMKQEEELRKGELDLESEKMKHAELLLSKERLECKLKDGLLELDIEEEERVRTELQEVDNHLGEQQSRCEDLEEKVRFIQGKISDMLQNSKENNYSQIEAFLMTDEKLKGNILNMQFVFRILLRKFVENNFEILKQNDELSKKLLENFDLKKDLENFEQRMKSAEYQYSINLAKIQKEYEERQTLWLKQGVLDIDDNEDEAPSYSQQEAVITTAFSLEIPVLSNQRAGEEATSEQKPKRKKEPSSDRKPITVSSAVKSAKKGSGVKDKVNSKILGIMPVNPLDIIQNDGNRSPGLKPAKEGPVLSISALKKLNEELTDKVIRMDKQIQDLKGKVRNSDKLSEMWKRKCETYQEKYDQIKKQTAKTGIFHKASTDINPGENISISTVQSSSATKENSIQGWSVNNTFNLSGSVSTNQPTVTSGGAANLITGNSLLLDKHISTQSSSGSLNASNNNLAVPANPIAGYLPPSEPKTQSQPLAQPNPSLSSSSVQVNSQSNMISPTKQQQQMIFTKAPAQSKGISIVSLKDRRREEKITKEVVNSSSINKESKLNEMLMSLELNQQQSYMLGSTKMVNSTGTPNTSKSNKRSDSSSKQGNKKKVHHKKAPSLNFKSDLPISNQNHQPVVHQKTVALGDFLYQDPKNDCLDYELFDKGGSLESDLDDFEISKYDSNCWECSNVIEDNGAIYCLASQGNTLYSAGNKYFKVWSLDNMKNISEVNAHQSFVKGMITWPEKNLLITACGKELHLWDLITLKNVVSLKGHKDEIRSLHISGDYLYSGGKGGSASGALMVWDVRSNLPLEEKEKNQEIFSLHAMNNILYIGNRNHQVRRMNLVTLETLSSFEPPHFDSVSSLTALSGSLVSGSRDKTLKLWNVDNAIPTLTTTTYAHQDWVNCLETSLNQSLLYSGCKDGCVKVWEYIIQNSDALLT